eukprot:SAG31_NODE_2776_length_5105_cov_2.652817_2_plen_43_part_00
MPSHIFLNDGNGELRKVTGGDFGAALMEAEAIKTGDIDGDGR